MTILEAIRAAVAAGKLQEPFTTRDVAAALREHHYSSGSLQIALARSSRPSAAQAELPLRRVGRGQYRLARPGRKALP